VNEDAIGRIERELGPDVIDRIAALPGADVTTLMLEIADRRTDALRAGDVLRRYETDRFARPGAIDPATIRRIEEALFAALPDGFDRVTLSPIAPLGAHRLAGVDQSRVVTTVRSNEVAADPTNVLALEAAVRRRHLLRADPRALDVVRLAASQRVTRGQLFEGEGVFAHFQLFGIVSAGRDTGNLTFEREAVVQHIRFVADAIRRVTGSDVVVELTDLTGGRMDGVTGAVGAAVGDATVEDRPDREAGRDYYDGICFKAYATSAGDRFEVADGGLVDWTQQLVPSRKERLMISGLGVERLALALSGSTRAT
jgi:hypothetical protein